MFRKVVLGAVACGVLLSACATKADHVSASYVSPLQYSNFDCDQVRMEMIRVSARVHEVAGVQNKQAKEDAWATGIGIVVFWPALFFLFKGDRKEELARLKGEYDALNEVAIEKKCPVAAEIQAAKDKHEAEQAAKKR